MAARPTIIKRFSTSEAIVNYFKKEIEEGRFLPGEKLPSERLLQKQLQISRLSLREGLARLNALGIIKVVQGKGAFIANEINSTSLSNVFFPYISNKTTNYGDIYELRMVIEKRTAFLAAHQRSHQDLIDLKQILVESEKAIEDANRFGEFDYLFHDQIAKAAGNIIFKKVLDVFNHHLRSFLYDHAIEASNRRKALKSHWKIYNCIKNKDANGAKNAIQSHIKNCKKSYESFLHNRENKK